jgi:uncharacterized membrane protein (UPF0127 family)
VGYVAVTETKTDSVVVPRARLCDTFFCKLRGLTFRRRLETEDALILAERSDGTSSTSIHMMFVFFPIAAIWINSTGKVVDCRLARPFRPVYIPRAPARYVLEGPPELLQLLHPGDQVRFDPLVSQL